jgi:hypothetical protein
MSISGIRYQYSDGGSVAIKYPRQNFKQAGQVTGFQDATQAPTGITETPQVLKPISVVMPGGGIATAAPPSGASAGPVTQNDFIQSPDVQTKGGGTTGSGGSGGGGDSGGWVGGIVNGILGAFNIVDSGIQTERQERNTEFNRNVARQNMALNKATTASNLRGAGQQQTQSDILFGEQQGQLKTAQAWSAGVAKGLTSGRT